MARWGVEPREPLPGDGERPLGTDKGETKTRNELMSNRKSKTFRQSARIGHDPYEIRLRIVCDKSG